MIRPRCSSFCAAALLLSLSGCAAVSLSSLSSLASLGDSSVSFGRDTYSFGKLRSAETCDLWATEDAVRAAATDLGLHVKESPELSDEATELNMAFVDDKGSQIGVRIERRSPRMVYLREDVGFLASFFGAEVADRLFLLQVRRHLPSGATAQFDTTRPSHESVVR